MGCCRFPLAIKSVSVYHQNNYLPFLSPIHASSCTTIFRVVELIELKSSTQDSSLLAAPTFVCQHCRSRKAEVSADINLCFASQRWRRPSQDIRFEHIDGLFTKSIDWALIERHWQDMMQVMLLIQAGKVVPSMLLRKLNSNNRQNRLYRAFRELGRVIRTLFLLRYLSESDLRHTIRAETTKIESYIDFLDWINFGGQVIKSGDPVEQTKQVKYTDLVANAIMLHNVSDLTNVRNQLTTEGLSISEECVSSLSPYIRHHIRRFGQYNVDMSERPPELASKSVPISQ